MILIDKFYSYIETYDNRVLDFIDDDQIHFWDLIDHWKTDSTNQIDPKTYKKSIEKVEDKYEEISSTAQKLKLDERLQELYYDIENLDNEEFSTKGKIQLEKDIDKYIKDINKGSTHLNVTEAYEDLIPTEFEILILQPLSNTLKNFHLQVLKLENTVSKLLNENNLQSTKQTINNVTNYVNNKSQIANILLYEHDIIDLNMDNINFVLESCLTKSEKKTLHNNVHKQDIVKLTNKILTRIR